jgi:hypothetical protein
MHTWNTAETGLNAQQGRYGDSLEPDWPGSAKITELTKYAAGLFIWADTALQFIGQKVDPVHRLALISENLAMGGNRVDQLYQNILEMVFQANCYGA